MAYVCLDPSWNLSYDGPQLYLSDNHKLFSTGQCKKTSMIKKFYLRTVGVGPLEQFFHRTGFIQDRQSDKTQFLAP
uniref:Uncharacterized protein n=1 Tax=Nelumbo nucifera TaxID=4432 RepID=A0A822XJ03_NELNU|nr:TPA_asm: hypothetical protein HUJ06_021146 [Nelumbo nucifera]